MKTPKYVLIIGLLLCFVCCLTGCTSADPAEYHQGDVEALQQLAEEHGWRLPEDSIAKWQHVTWSKEQPKRIETLYLMGMNEPITGTLDVSAFSGLKVLWCMDNAIDELILPENIEELDCPGNRLTELDLTNKTNLRTVWCHNNQIEKIYYDTLPALEVMYCNDNQLSEFNFEGTPNLINFNGWNNQLTNVQISSTSKLVTLDCTGSQLTELQLDGLQNLENVRCSMASLKQLSLNNLPALKSLGSEGAQLETIEIVNTPNLMSFFCYENAQLACFAEGFQLESFDYFNRTVTFVKPDVETLDLEKLSGVPEDAVINGNRLTVTIREVEDPSGIIINDEK